MPHITNWPVVWGAAFLIGGYLFVASYIVLPLIAKFTQSLDTHANFIPIEFDDLPPDMRHAFHFGARWLSSAGFQALGIVSQGVPRPQKGGYVSLWTNSSPMDSAQIIGVCASNALAGSRTAILVGYRTEFTDGTSIETSNSSSPTCFPADLKTNSVRCPGIHDISLLYRFHRARVDRDRGKRLATLERVKDASLCMRLEHVETFARLEEAGYFVLNRTGEKYVPTIKGAFMMTYRLLPPFKQIQKLRKDTLVDRTLRDTGFGGTRAFRKAQSSMPAANFNPVPVEKL